MESDIPSQSPRKNCGAGKGYSNAINQPKQSIHLKSEIKLIVTFYCKVKPDPVYTNVIMQMYFEIVAKILG